MLLAIRVEASGQQVIRDTEEVAQDCSADPWFPWYLRLASLMSAGPAGKEKWYGCKADS